MGSIRLYSGDDGESHIEEIDPVAHPEWSQLQNANGIVFRASPPGYFSDWHVAPRRQYIITLSRGRGNWACRWYGAPPWARRCQPC